MFVGMKKATIFGASLGVSSSLAIAQTGLITKKSFKVVAS
jgi:hypothetical protein